MALAGIAQSSSGRHRHKHDTRYVIYILGHAKSTARHGSEFEVRCLPITHALYNMFTCKMEKVSRSLTEARQTSPLKHQH